MAPAPTPWNARPASMVLGEGEPVSLTRRERGYSKTYSMFLAAPHMADPTAKKMSAPSKMGRRPKTCARPPALWTKDNVSERRNVVENSKLSDQGMKAAEVTLRVCGARESQLAKGGELSFPLRRTSMRYRSNCTLSTRERWQL